MRDGSKTSRLPRGFRPAPRWHTVAIAVVCLGGVLLSGLVWMAMRAWDREHLQVRLNQQAAEQAELLEKQMLRSMEVLHSIGSLFAAHGHVDRESFHNFVADALERQPELQALGWTPVVPAAERPSLERSARAEGLTDFTITQQDSHGHAVVAGVRPTYFPVLYIEPEQSNSLVAGYDLGSDRVRSAALDQAGRTADVVATPPVKLVQERDGDIGFIVYLPVYDRFPVPAERRAHLLGFASAVFRVQSLFAPTASALAPLGLNVRIFDQTDGNSAVLFGRPLSADQSSDAQIPVGSDWLNVASRLWTVSLRPTPAYLASFSDHRPDAGLAAGLLITALLGAYLFAELRGREAVERRVAERTVELSREVQERKRAEHAARLAEAKYREIFENATEGIFQTTPDGQYISANRSLARIYGYKSTSQLVRDLSNIAGQLYVNRERRRQFIAAVQRDGSVSDFVSQVYRKDGAIIWISENARAVRGEGNEVLYYEGSTVDITERMEAEAMLRRHRDELEARVHERTLALARANASLHAEIAERRRAEEQADAASRAKTIFLARMSHEIRTPMNAILGYAQVLYRDPTLRQTHHQAMRTILSSGRHLLSLIDDILEISKIEAGHVELRSTDFDLAGLVHDVAGMFRQRCEQKRLTLLVECAASCRGAVSGDDRKVRQVLINLLANAVKFTDEGSVTLRVRREEHHHYRFEVSDSGVGIEPKALAMIFEPFNQGPSGNQRGGAGLGLAIARQLIGVMGGELQVESQCDGPLRGSTFSFTLELPALTHDAPRTTRAIAQTNGFQEQEAFLEDQTVVMENPPIVTGLPGPLRAELISAARLYRVTDLRRYIDEIERLSPAAQEACGYFRQCLSRYDMDSLIQSLEK